MTDRILLIEDDPRLAEMVKNYLGEAGFAVTVAPRGMAGIALEARETFDALVLDLMLPDIDGLEVCRRIRARSQTPISRPTTRSMASPREMLARLRAILRRRGREQRTDVLRFGSLDIDVGARQARLNGAECELTDYQFSLLLVLAQHPGRVMSRDAIMELMKNERLESFDRSIDVHISRIRAAIEDDPKKPRRIITVRGSGYVFAKAQD